MRQFNKLALLFLLATASSARKVKFSVVSFGSSVKVNVDGKNFNLSKVDNDTPLFQSTLSVSDNAISYKYVVDGKSEEFTRKLEKGKSTTHNEFFGRKYTVKELPQLPTVYEWKNFVGRGELFDDSYIPTIHITGKKSQAIFETKGPAADYAEKIVFILKDNVYSFKNAICKTKNTMYNKQQFKIKFTSGDIEGRYVLKFRDNNEDPTFLRQDLYGDILTALGHPTIQSVKARVYLNGKPYGYYILQEEAASQSFVRAAFHGDNNGHYSIKKKQVGQVFDCSTGSDFYYTGNNKINNFIAKGDYDHSRVTALNKAFENLNTNDAKAVQKFNDEWFDIDTFYKAVTMEYLTAHWDSYLFYSSNFAVYFEPDGTHKSHFICQDWDQTFGLAAGVKYMRFKDYMTRSYRDYVNYPGWGEIDHESKKRYAFDKLLSTPELVARFEEILKTTVDKLFNPEVLNKRIDALVERHRDEIAWNYDVIRNQPIHHGYKGVRFTIEDFEKNINKEVHGIAGLKDFIKRRSDFVKKDLSGKHYVPPTETTKKSPVQTPINDNGNKNYPVSEDGHCGVKFGTRCPDNQCCSKYGYCDISDAHCGAGCQSEFGACYDTDDNKKQTPVATTVKKVNTTTTKKANVATTKKVVTTTKKAVTTTKKNQNKTTKKNKKTIKSTKKVAKTKKPSKDKISKDGRCGAKYGKCPNNGCCSKYGYCGTTSEYCKAGCQKAFGKCK